MPNYTSWDDTKLWYERTGTGTGVPLLVLPGGPGMDARYLDDLAGLGRDRDAVFLDPRATGRSGVPQDRSTVAFTAQARDVEALRGHLGADRVDVLGHSAGCLVAQEYAAAHPERVRRLVLVTPVGRAAREPDPAEIAALRAARSAEPWYASAAEADRRLAEGGLTAERQSVLSAHLTPFFWYRWDDETQAAYARGQGAALPWLREAFYAGSATSDTADERLARLAAARTPVLVLAGAYDGMIGTAPARLAAALHPGSRLEILPRSGHRPWVEEPGLFRSLVAGFLDAADGRP
ncbi:alpha/beta fold hydrolase [Yinghuangia soli]|uniref:Alpha/beta hydrolase n=1 Tax=Yinghuangia soli TaxID=2908204 RepID=A0AA41U2M8_9ACTN|nr:alpha/beta hydrolase [Yinghuangia soli]MCF2528812.1 alpha/beta hydrolase [Yinghuangia soli]